MAQTRARAKQVTFKSDATGGVVRYLHDKLSETVSVKDFGAVGDGVTDDTAAIQAALAVSSHVFIPSGIYKVSSQIDIVGDRTITGPDGGTQAFQSATIDFTGASGNVFSAVSAEFGGVCIRNLKITGGNGSYAIRSSRPQSLFENLLIEGYDGGGIQLFEAGTGSQASWGCAVKNVKWVGPSTPSNYRGIDVTQNGGHLLIENFTAIYGAIGININQGEAIDIIRCSLNQQSVYSSSSATDTCSIRLSGSGYKKAVSIRECYIEGYIHGIYVEKCESLTIENNYIADLGQSSNYGSVWLADDASGGLINNVTIRNNHINDDGNNMVSVYIGDRATNVLLMNNYIVCDGGYGGAWSTCVRKGSTTTSWAGFNTLFRNPSFGTEYDDPNGLLSFALEMENKIEYIEGTWTPSPVAVANCSGITVTGATYTKVGRQISLHISGTLTVTAATTLTSFTFTVPESTAALSDPSVGTCMLNFTGVGFVVDNSGGDANTAYVGFPANQVLSTGSQPFALSLTYNT